MDKKKENDILKNANPNTPVVLGTLKKEKSSKPFLVLIIFALLITTVFMFPNIKKYMATNDNAVTRFYNSYLKSFLENDNSNDYYYDLSTTTKASTDVQKTDVQCASLGDVYVYHFLNNKLKSITHTLTITKGEDLDEYSKNLENYKYIAEYYKNTLSLDTILNENDDNFVFENVMDLSKTTPSNFERFKNGNYYDLDTLKDVIIKNEQTKGFTCE